MLLLAGDIVVPLNFVYKYIGAPHVDRRINLFFSNYSYTDFTSVASSETIHFSFNESAYKSMQLNEYRISRICVKANDI